MRQPDKHAYEQAKTYAGSSASRSHPREACSASRDPGHRGAIRDAAIRLGAYDAPQWPSRPVRVDSVHGRDTGAGTSSAPLKTLGEALKRLPPVNPNVPQIIEIIVKMGP